MNTKNLWTKLNRVSGDSWIIIGCFRLNSKITGYNRIKSNIFLYVGGLKPKVVYSDDFGA